MSDVVVGMRLKSTLAGGPQCPVIVTELTARGFKYDLDIQEESLPFIPRWGMTMAKRGHEHYGVDGEAQYEEIK